MPATPLHHVSPRAPRDAHVRSRATDNGHGSRQAACQRGKAPCPPPPPQPPAQLKNTNSLRQGPRKREEPPPPPTLLSLLEWEGRQTDSAKQLRKAPRRDWAVTGKACSGWQARFQLPASPSCTPHRYTQAGRTSPFFLMGWFFFHLGPARCRQRGGCPGERSSPAETLPALSSE